MFEGIRFALLSYDLRENFKLESLRRYWDHFGLKVEETDSLDGRYDLLIFLESSVDDARREEIIRRRIPSIAILDFLDDRYDTIPNIVPLTFPIYCTKLQSAITDVLGSKNGTEHLMDGTKGRTGFEGKVLVAEDNSANQELIKIILERYGLSHTIASDGLEAEEEYRNGSYDLILMDEQMPRMGGNEATAAILEYEREKGLEHTPIVALTANVIKGSRERSIQNGYDAFLGKPIVLREIEQIFERYLKPVVLSLVVNEGTFPPRESRIDMDHLKSALMLEEEQIEHLLGIYRQKMERSFQELQAAIDAKTYEDIAFIAHSIKGSSANFRFDELSRISYVIEESATSEDEEFDFTEAYNVLLAEFAKRFE
jgi:CheY-like chemotaxis protein